MFLKAKNVLLAAAGGWGKDWPENLEKGLMSRGDPSARCWKQKKLCQSAQLPRHPLHKRLHWVKESHEWTSACSLSNSRWWQDQGVPRECQEESKGRKNGKQVRPHNSSVKQRGKWGLPCLVPYLSVTSAGIWTPLVSMFFKVWPPFGLFWGCLLGKSGTVTAAYLHSDTGERLGHRTRRILWQYPATDQQVGQVNINETVALWTPPYAAQERWIMWYSCINTTLYPCFPH